MWVLFVCCFGLIVVFVVGLRAVVLLICAEFVVEFDVFLLKKFLLAVGLFGF